MTTSVCVVIPVFNDWQSLSVLLQGLDRSLSGFDVTVLAIDDCTPGGGAPTVDGLVNISEVRVVRLLRNVGHQQAIAVGLSYCNVNVAADWYVVMDADGEDRPEDVSRLLERAGSRSGTVVFGARGKRSEGPLFRFSYWCYQLLYWVLVGRVIDFGNFSCIPRRLLAKVASIRQISSHYSSGITHSKLSHDTVMCQRGHRYAGKSKMNVTSLWLHGLSAISVHSDLVMVRALIFLVILFCVLMLTGVAVLYVKLFTDLALPGWATTVMLNLTSLMIQVIFMNFICVFLFINISAQNKHLPPLEHDKFIASVEVAS